MGDAETDGMSSEASERAAASVPEAGPAPDAGSADAASEHVRPPRQERSRKTLQRIVDAARSLIAEEGVRAATVSRVVERADSSVGSFYARFQGKDDLLRYLEERVWSVARERWEEAMASRSWDDLELEGVVRSVVRMLVRIRVEDAGTRRVLEREKEAGRGLGEEADRFHALVEDDVRNLLLRHRNRLSHPRPERAAVIAYRWAVGGIRELLTPGRDGDTLDPQTTTEEVSRGLMAYLTGEGAEGGPHTEGAEFFDIWQ